jgi:YegS/Rv2252/BmrU family lipid kinase
MRGALSELLRSSFGNNCTLFTTGKPGEALVSAREALLEGSRRLVIVGGDGTIHECVNGILSLPSHLQGDLTIAIISTGTGCGLARSLGITGTIEEQVAIAKGTSLRAIDIGRFIPDRGQVRVFVNECQIGIGAEVVRMTRNGKKALGGSLAYALATVPLLFTYPNPEVELELENSAPISLRVTGISIGNGAITGGGMHLTPRAVLDDGLIDVLVMKGQSPLSRTGAFLRLRSGSHVDSPSFDYHQTRTVRITTREILPVAADGEIVGYLPGRFETHPHALRIHCSLNPERKALHELVR